MKRSVSSDTSSEFNKVTLEKILTIEKEVMELKLFVLRKLGPTGKKIIKLRGLVSNELFSCETHLFFCCYNK